MTAATVIDDLRRLAPTHTQAEAARAVKRSRERVRQIADQHGIAFVDRDGGPPPVCGRCRHRLHDGYPYCLRCRWTRNRIRRLRRRLALTQLAFSALLGVAIGTVQRWEAGTSRPKRRALAALEGAEKRT